MTSNQDISCVGRACTGCAACSDACPVDSISMVPDAEGFVYPSINGASCLACGNASEYALLLIAARCAQFQICMQHFLMTIS